MAQKHAATDTAAEAGLAKALSTGTALCLEGIEPKSLLPGKTNKQTSPNPSDICLFPRKKNKCGKKKKKTPNTSSTTLSFWWLLFRRRSLS